MNRIGHEPDCGGQELSPRSSWPLLAAPLAAVVVFGCAIQVLQSFRPVIETALLLAVVGVILAGAIIFVSFVIKAPRSGQRPMAGNRRTM